MKKTKQFKYVRGMVSRLLVVAAGARWMDLHYPNWFTGVTTFVKQNRFNIHQVSACVIGAGTGHQWTMPESDEIRRYVARTTGFTAASLTSSTEYEAFWIAEAFRRLGKIGGR